MKNEKGFIPVILAVVVVVAAVGIGGYAYMSKNKTGILEKAKLPAVKLPGAGLNPNCKFKDPDLCKYVNKYASMEQFSGGFSGKSTTTDKDGKKSESVWEMEGLNKSRFVTYENGKELFSTVIINDTTYTKDPTDGKWWKYVATKDKAGANTNFFNPEDLKEQFKDLEDKTAYKKIGKEQCGSLSCFKYEVETPGLEDTKEYVYFDDNQYLMRKMEVETGGMKTATVFEYKNVSIKEPSPVKEGEPGFNTFFNLPTSEEVPASGGESPDMQEELKKILENMPEVQEGGEPETSQ
jgi:hypothetical protein